MKKAITFLMLSLFAGSQAFAGGWSPNYVAPCKEASQQKSISQASLATESSCRWLSGMRRDQCLASVQKHKDALETLASVPDGALILFLNEKKCTRPNGAICQGEELSVC